MQSTAPPAPVPALAKLEIVNLDEVVARDRSSRGLVAQYNPRELAVDQAVTWTPSTTSKGDHPELTFGGGSGKTISLELFFDTFESGEDVHRTHVAPLQELLLVMSTTRGEAMKRPPRVMIMWGDDLPRIVAVVVSVNVKYTVFLPGGRPVRATCAVKFMEASRGNGKGGRV